MKIIGVTGTSGAGKSTICKILNEKYNAEIIDSDKVAKSLSKKGSVYLKSIANCFGNDILDENGELKRKELAQKIYSDEKSREDLNKLTFIYVVDEIKAKIAKLENKEIIVVDAPLLFESDLNQICDFNIGVIADKEEKIKRIIKRDNLTEDEAKKRLEIQKDDEFFKEYADYVIENNENVEKIEEQLQTITEMLQK